MTTIECSICLEEKKNFKTLLCGHSFCLDCINKLIEHNEFKKCALCRTVIVTNLRVIIPSRNNYIYNSSESSSDSASSQHDIENPRRQNPGRRGTYSCQRFCREHYDFAISISFAGLMLIFFIVLIIGYNLDINII